MGGKIISIADFKAKTGLFSTLCTSFLQAMIFLTHQI